MNSSRKEILSNFALKINEKNIDSAIDFIKVIISLSTAIIAAFAFKMSLTTNPSLAIKGSVFFSFLSLMFGLIAFLQLGAQKGGFNDHYANIVSNVSFNTCLLAFFTSISILILTFFRL